MKKAVLSSGHFVGFRLIELGGVAPFQHRSCHRSSSPKPHFYPGQIWVDPDTEKLWEIIKLPSSHIREERKRMITLTLYGRFWKSQKMVREARLPHIFRPLETALACGSTRLSDLKKWFEARGGENAALPDLENFIRSFGIDPLTGYRVD